MKNGLRRCLGSCALLVMALLLRSREVGGGKTNHFGGVVCDAFLLEAVNMVKETGGTIVRTGLIIWCRDGVIAVEHAGNVYLSTNSKVDKSAAQYMHLSQFI